MVAAILNLNQPAHYVHWHFFEMSVSNLAVIIAMLIVFAVALLAPFPGAKSRSTHSAQEPSAEPDRPS